MRPLLLSLGAFALVLGTAWAQKQDGGETQQLPVGQTFKNFEFPIYQDGKLKATLTAAQAIGITQNRAETTDVKIKIFDNGTVTTTVTSPKADLYVADRKMRTKNTVHIVRADSDATAQACDFDMANKKYLLRTNVRVILKNFDAGAGSKNAQGAPPAHAHAPTGVTAPPVSTPAVSTSLPARRSADDDSMLDSPGAYSSTNSAPTPPTSPDTK